MCLLEEEGEKFHKLAFSPPIGWEGENGALDWAIWSVNFDLVCVIWVTNWKKPRSLIKRRLQRLLAGDTESVPAVGMGAAAPGRVAATQGQAGKMFGCAPAPPKLSPASPLPPLKDRALKANNSAFLVGGQARDSSFQPREPCPVDAW